jgi:hypothetical protein
MAEMPRRAKIHFQRVSRQRRPRTHRNHYRIGRNDVLVQLNAGDDTLASRSASHIVSSISSRSRWRQAALLERLR